MSRMGCPQHRALVRRSRGGLSLLACASLGGVFAFSLAVDAGQSRTAQQGVYTSVQAGRGQATYRAQCAGCHGDTLAGGLAPALSGDLFVSTWADETLAALASKIRNTMPADAPATLSPQQVAELVAYFLQASRFPAGQAELGASRDVLMGITMSPGRAASAPSGAAPAAQAPSFPAAGNLAQVMRGILFPSSNLLFNVQNQDPGIQKVGWKPGETAFSSVEWGAGIYAGWDLVDYAAVALAESAPLMLTPGRRCENGRPVPVDRPDWIMYTRELVDAGKAAYKASQSRDRDAVIEITNQVADSCLHCHDAYRDKPGGTDSDPSNKAARCVP